MATMTQKSAPPTVIGVDIGKDVFHLVGFSAAGELVFRRKIKRLALADTFRALPPCIVGMEACLSAHFVSRILRARSQAADHPGDLRAPLRQGPEERLQ